MFYNKVKDFNLIIKAIEIKIEYKIMSYFIQKGNIFSNAKP